MQKRYVFLFLLNIFFFSCSLYASETPYEQVVFGGEPSAVIDGCINAITGTYFINEDDWIVNGHEPIPIRRRYLSSQAEEEKFGGWEFFFHHLIAIRECVEVETEPKRNCNDEDVTYFYHYELSLPEKYGFSLNYKTKIYSLSPTEGKYKLKEPYPKSLTNCFTGEIGARLNAYNNNVYTDPNNARVILVESADGTKRGYENIDRDDYYYLRWETLPNTNVIHYQWQKSLRVRRLSKITTTDSSGQKHYASLSVEYYSSDDKHLNAITFRTSDNHAIIYHIRNLKHGNSRYWVISKIEHSGRPNESYDYWGPKKTDGCPLVERIFQLGQKKHIDYLDIGNQGIKNERDAKFKRVGSFALPIHIQSTSSNPKLIRLLFLTYQPGKYEKGAGSTSVYDCYGNYTHYFYDKDFLLKEVHYNLGNTETFLKEVFEWTPYDSKKGHWLKAKKLFGKGNQFLREVRYHYDEKGNVRTEELTGNLQGLYPHTSYSEKALIYRAFNERNLLTEEKFPNGKRIEYTYRAGTALLEKKLIFDHNTLKIRHFYVYEGSFLKRKITDNGSSTKPSDLSGVTTSLIRDFHPKKASPFLDFPIIIEEKYYDPASGTERLLSKQEILRYNNHGHPEEVAYFDANGNQRYTNVLSYDTQGRLIKQTDPIGREKRISYDANDNIISLQNPNDPLATQYRYDLANRLTEKTQNSRKTLYNYNYLHRITKETDFKGNATHYAPNRFGHPIKITLPQIQSDTNQPKTPIQQRIYNSLGKVHIETDPEGNQTETYYTSRGDPYRVIHPDQAEDLYTYDISGNLKSHTTPEETKTEYAYDFLDRMVSKKVFSKEGDLLLEEGWVYDGLHLIEKTDLDGVKTIYDYDGVGRKTQETILVSGNEEVTRYEYDEMGRLFRTIRRINQQQCQILEKRYDLLDRVIEEKELDQEGKKYSITIFTYDDYDNQIAYTKEVQVGPAVEKTIYDHFKRLIKHIDPLGNVTTIHYDDSFQNTLGQKVLKKTTTNPKGTQTVEIFDAHENLSLLEKRDPQENLLLREEFFYNRNNQKIKQASTITTSQKTIIKTWEYDFRGRLITLTESPGEEHEKITEYDYTLDGHLMQVIKPSGLFIHYTYDSLGRKTFILTSDGTCNYQLFYDAMGRVIKAENILTQGITQRTYDHFGNLLTEETEHGLKTNHTYDSLGRKIQLIFPDQSSVKYDYDAYHLTGAIRLDSTGKPLYHHFYQNYDQSHNLLSEQFIGNLGEGSYTIDLLERPIQRTSPYMEEEVWGFDPNGNLLGFNRKARSEQETYRFDYDALDQIIQEESPFSHVYQFDAHYDRLQKDTTPYETNSHHELLGTDQIDYEYNWDGHLAKEIQKRGKLEYIYDGLERLVAIKSQDLLKQFHYDYFNRLLSQTTFTPKNGEWTYSSQESYLYDGQNELGAYPHELRILGQGKGAEIGAAIAIEKQGKVYAPIHDFFGNVVALIDPHSRKVVESYRYSAFGEERVSVTSIGNPWRFQSKRKIGELVCFGRRFYHPETGRWISPDPKGFEEGPHLYQFNRNNPFVHIDLYGEELASLWSPIAGPGNCFSNSMTEQEEKERNWDLALSVLDKNWSNPHFQGSLEAFGGAAETAVGNLLTTVSLASGNPGGLVLGMSVTTHGLDRFFTGVNNAITGGYQESVTAQSLQAAGVSKEKAHIVDGALSFGGIVYGTGLIRNASRLINPPFLLPETPFSRPGSFAGKESPFPVQMHHFATNKSQTFTPRMKRIVDEYGLNLNEAWNKELMHHIGRHPDKYHLFVLRGMKQAKKEAGNNQKVFLELFEKYVKEPVLNNPDLLNKSGWE